MKKLLLLTLVLLGGFSTVSAEDVVKIKGSWDGWALHTMTNTSGNIYSISLTLSGTGTYQFGIDVNGTFYKNSGTMYWYNCTNWVFKTTDSNCTINLADTGSGSYTFVWDNSTKKLSVTYPNLETVYFYNNHNWPNVFVYFLGSEYWDSNTNKGSGSKGRKNAYEMTQMGTSSIYQFTYPKSFSSAYIAFLKNRQDGYEYFWDTEAVYKDNFNSSKPLYVPNMTGPINKNYTDNNTKWTAYWNDGEWQYVITPGKEYTTYVTLGDADFTGLELKAYKATSANASGVVFDEVGAVPANTPLLLKGTAGTLYNVPVAASAGTVEGNKLVAGDGTTEIGGASKYDYILSDGKFYRAEEGTVAVGKAYLHLDSAPADARELTILFSDDDETDGINAVKGMMSEISGESYNLAGQKVSNDYKGIVIVNGKKVVRK